jgi:hypothetical protein
MASPTRTIATRSRRPRDAPDARLTLRAHLNDDRAHPCRYQARHPALSQAASGPRCSTPPSWSTDSVTCICDPPPVRDLGDPSADLRGLVAAQRVGTQTDQTRLGPLVGPTPGSGLVRRRDDPSTRQRRAVLGIGGHGWSSSTRLTASNSAPGSASA